MRETLTRKLQEHQAKHHSTIEDEWVSLRDNVLTAASDALGKRKPGSNDWFEPHREVIKALIDARDEAKEEISTDQPEPQRNSQQPENGDPTLQRQVAKWESEGDPT